MECANAALNGSGHILRLIINTCIGCAALFVSAFVGEQKSMD